MSTLRMQSIHFLLFLTTLVAATLLSAADAYAVSPFALPLSAFSAVNAGGGDATTLGGMMSTLTENLTNFPLLFSAVSYLMGLVFCAYGLLNFVKHVDNPSREPINTPIRYLFAGAFFIALPALAGIAVRTFGLADGDALDLGLEGLKGGQVGTVDGMLMSLSSDIYGPSLMLLSAFSYVAGIFVLMNAIFRLTKSMDQGPRGPLGLGTVMSFFLAAILLSAPQALSGISSTLFGDAGIVTNPVFADGAGMDADLKARAEAIMTAIESFLIIIGVISFFRGWFILRSVADGNGQATAMSAFSHIIAGVIAVNIGPFVNAVQQTFGLDPANGLLFQ